MATGAIAIVGVWAIVKGPGIAKYRFGELLADQVEVEPGALAAERESAKRAGIPLTPEEHFARPVPNDPNNAGPIYSELFGTANKLRSLTFTSRDAAVSYMREKGPIPPDLVDQLAKDGPLLDRVGLASKKPLCIFDRKWEDGMATLFPEFAGMKSAGIALACRAYLKAQDGEVTGSLEDFDACAQLANHAGQEPALIQALVDIAIGRITLNAVVASAMVRFDDVHYLNQLKVIVSKVTLPDMRRAILGELVMSVTTIRDIPRIIKDDLLGPDAVSDAERGFASKTHVREAAEVRTIRFYRELLSIVENNSQNPRALAQALDHLDEEGKGPDLVLNAVQSLTSGGSPFSSLTAISWPRYLTEKQLASSAIDVLLFRRSMGKLPSLLSQLGPVPMDAISGEPIRYVRTRDGFALYGLGPNFRDDKLAKDADGRDLDQVVRISVP